MLEDKNGQELLKKDFDLKQAESWNDLVWDFSEDSSLFEKIENN